jgi:ATP-dependent helicase/nuclease subunit A
MKPRVDVHIKRDGSKALGWFKVEKRTEGSWAAKLLGQHADWEEHEAAELPFLEAEQTRLFYVAATRARQMLVVSRSAANKGNPAWGVLNDNLGAAKELPVPATVKVASSKPATTTAKAQAEALAARISADGRVTTPSWSITSVTAEAKHVARMVPPAELIEGDATRVVTQDTPAHRADAGLAWGTLIHGLLEHAMRHKGATRHDLRRLALWLTVEEPQLRGVVDQAIDTVERAARADFWSLAQSHSRSVETPFTVIDSRQLTNGVIDLMFESEPGWQVVDYKTDQSLVEARYSAQLDAYRTALTRVGCAVAGAAVVNVRTEPI